MKILVNTAGAFLLAILTVSAQTPSPTASAKSDSAQLEALSLKLDQQNAKIDALSQHLLKIEQELSKPGVPVGETSPAPVAPMASPASSIQPAGPTHTVARGETLTAIAKTYKVTVGELQRLNHIEDGRKLQAGQTIQIPTAENPAPSPSPSASAAPNE